MKEFEDGGCDTMTTVERIYKETETLSATDIRALINLLLDRLTKPLKPFIDEDDGADVLTDAEVDEYMRLAHAVTEGLTDEEIAIIERAALDRSGWERTLPAL